MTLLPALDLATGLVLLCCGVLTWWRRPGTWVGPLLALAGVTWFLGSVLGALVFLHRGPLVHLHVTYPTGRIHRPLVGVVAVIAYAASVYEGVVGNAWITLGIAVLVALTALDVFRRTSGRARKAGGPALAAAFAFAGILALSAVNVAWDLSWDTGVAATYDVVVCLIAVGLTADLLVGRWTEATLSDLVTQLAPDTDTAGLQAALRRAVGDPTLVLGWWQADRDLYVDDTGSEVTATSAADRAITTVDDDEGRPSAVLVHASAVLDDPALLAGACAAVRLSLGNERMRVEAQGRVAQLATARRRVVEAGDAQRQVLSRLLADGAQAHLHRLGLLLDEAAGSGGDVAARAEVRRLRREVDAAQEDVSRLAAGIRPLELESGGLPDALPALAARSGLEVDVSVEQVRLPSTDESALYFCCAEALTNVAKHADGARVVRITLRSTSRGVEVEVADDGAGGAVVDAGSGLRGLRDRLEALGGTLSVASGPGGTTLRATLPSRNGREAAR